MNNKDNYKNAINQIHANEGLKEKTIQNIQNNKSSKNNIISLLSTCVAAIVIIFAGINSLNFDESKPITVLDKNQNLVKESIVINNKLPKFESMDELIYALEKEENYNKYNGEIALESETTDSISTTLASDSINKSLVNDLSGDYSTTNVQTENVYEADIVKTDGEYIYYVSNNKVFIVQAENLEIISVIEMKNENNEQFYLSEIYLNDDKIVLLGSDYTLNEKIITFEENTTDSIVSVDRIETTKAVVYDIKDKYNPIKEREVALEGSYIDSRMIGDNLYFISCNYIYYYEGINENTILPIIEDSNLEEIKQVTYNDIYYFENTNSSCFMMVGGFNINENNDVNVETFFGAGSIVYSSENNLYLTKQVYDENYKTTIYKFALDNSKVELVAQAEVEGMLNNQFSMDEYDGNLRVATTSRVVIKPEVTEEIGNGIMRTTIGEVTTTNSLYILNEDLEEIGKIENLAKDEKIYSVRFIGKIGYIVTFKQIDPLFVIDLSDPTNPIVKGELKIPGYSSYLHPYDETHIIGIGYNTKENGYGGTTNANMKMSMFDVSDLENPLEIFSVDIGDDYAYSEITNNHKVLFYKKSENLIGFPVNVNNYNYSEYKNGFVVFRIDLENNQFEEYGKILNEQYYKTNIKRVIYIEDILYTLSNSQIISYNLNTFEKIDEVELTTIDNINYYEDIILY